MSAISTSEPIETLITRCLASISNLLSEPALRLGLGPLAVIGAPTELEFRDSTDSHPAADRCKPRV